MLKQRNFCYKDKGSLTLDQFKSKLMINQKKTCGLFCRNPNAPNSTLPPITPGMPCAQEQVIAPDINNLVIILEYIIGRELFIHYIMDIHGIMVHVQIHNLNMHFGQITPQALLH
jgi:hypothetical protein